MTIDDLKCCGNCNYFGSWGALSDAKTKCIHDCELKSGFEYCSLWEWDEHKKKDRIM